MELANGFTHISIYIWSIFLLLSGFYLISSNIFENNFETLKIFKESTSRQVRLEVLHHLYWDLNLQAQMVMFL